MYKKPSEGASTAAQENFKWYQSLTGADKEVAAKILRITDKKADEFSASNLISLIQTDVFLTEFSNDEKARVTALVKSKVPGFQPNDSASVPQQVESAGDSSLQAARKRVAELRAQGKSDEEIKSILEQEGIVIDG